MNYPKTIRTLCPSCRKHTEHSVRNISKGRARSLAAGTLKHERKLKGYVGKVAGEKPVKKQGKRQRVLLVCSVCKKAHPRTVTTRTKKRIELKSE